METLTPAAKKRRGDAAKATLKKPFRSPLIKGPQAGGTGTRGGSHLTPIGSRPSTPLKDVEKAAPDDEDPPAAAAASPERRHKSVKPLAGPRAAPKSSTQAPTGDLSRLVAELERSLAETDKQLREDEDLVEQADRIRRESERQRPGQAVGVELRELVAKWKAASRLAAEQVFEIVRERVAREGGTKAWGEMRRRQQEFFGGTNDDHGAKPGVEGRGGGTEGSSQVYEGASQQACQDNRGSSERQDEDGDDDYDDDEFTMSHMLDSLNIPQALLGYDEEKADWRD